MKFYLAPMEGITGYIFRNNYQKFFYPMDKYFTPFISPNNSKKLITREIEDILPENNLGMVVVPQILTNCAEDFIRVAHKLNKMGYDEINLNLGCPSEGVAGKGKGAGFLAWPDELDCFLEKIFSVLDMKLSIKSRLGMRDTEEWSELLDIYNRYPLHELILHPRVQQDFYQNTPKLLEYGATLKTSNNSLCYNGDINTVDDYQTLMDLYPQTGAVMLGRGVLRNPGLVGELRGHGAIKAERLIEFQCQLLGDYSRVLPHSSAVLAKMKELWFYWGQYLCRDASGIGEIKRSGTLKEYEEAVSGLFRKMEKEKR